jgi:hypothetical protein
MCTTGHNSYKACHFCYIHGVYYQGNRHVYYPLKPPTGVSSGSQYDPNNLPLRTHENYKHDATVVNHVYGSTRKSEVQKRGILINIQIFGKYFYNN